MLQNTRGNTETAPVNERAGMAEPRATALYGAPFSTDGPPPQHRPGRWHPLVVCAIALLAAWTLFLLTGGLSISSIQRVLPAHTFSLNGHGTLVVNETSGSVHIHPGSPDRVVVRGKMHTASLADSVHTPQVQYTQNGNTVTITTSQGWMLSGWSEVTLDITAPAAIDLSIHTSSANVVIESITGPIHASASSGNLDLHHTNGSLKLSTSSGDINMTDERGPVSAHTTSGNISAVGLYGTIDLSTTSGNITVARAQIDGLDHLRTSSGDLSFSGTLDAYGRYRMETSSGNITLQLPAASSFQLSASSNSGELYNEFAADLVGSTPHARLELQTSSGNMDIRQQ